MPDFKLRWIVLLLIALPLPAFAIDGPTPAQVVTPGTGFSELEGEIRGEEAEAAHPPERARAVPSYDYDARVEQLALERQERRRAQVGTGVAVSLLGAGLTLATMMAAESEMLTMLTMGVWIGGTALAIHAVGTRTFGVASQFGPSLAGSLLGLMIGTGVGAMAGFIVVVVAFITDSVGLLVLSGIVAGACVLLGPPVGAMIGFESGARSAYRPEAEPAVSATGPTVRFLSGPPAVARNADGWVVRQNLATVRF